MGRDAGKDFGMCSTDTGRRHLGISSVLQTTCPLQLPLLSPQQPSGRERGWHRHRHCSRLTGRETEAPRSPLVEGWSKAGTQLPPAPSLPACPGCAPGPHLVPRGPHIRSLLPPSRPHPAELTLSWAEGSPIWQSFAIHQEPFPLLPAFNLLLTPRSPSWGTQCLLFCQIRYLQQMSHPPVSAALVYQRGRSRENTPHPRARPGQAHSPWHPSTLPETPQ